MKVAMIGYLGMSPAVMTEMVRYLAKERLTDVVMLPTRDDFVMAGARLVEAAIRVNYPKIRVHIHFLPLDDITSEEENMIAAQELSKAICREKRDYGVRYFYLNVAGGRKETTIMATLLGMYHGATGAYHIINKNVKDLNLYQHKIANLIQKFIESDIDKRIEMYAQHKKVLDKLLFPDPRDLEFIRIPVIPPFPYEVSFLKRLLSPGGIDLNEERIPDFVLEVYRNAELITYSDIRAWPTDMGIEIGKMLGCKF